MTCLRPAGACGALLAALDASEGRRGRRKRDITPDAIGMSLKRRLLEQAILSDPEPDCLEAWLLGSCLSDETASTGMRLELLCACGRQGFDHGYVLRQLQMRISSGRSIAMRGEVSISGVPACPGGWCRDLLSREAVLPAPVLS